MDLAKTSENLEYPGLSYADAAFGPSCEAKTDEDDAPVYIRLADSFAQAEPAAFAPPRPPPAIRGRGPSFHDPKGIYPLLNEKVLEPRPASLEDCIFSGRRPPRPLRLRNPR